MATEETFEFSITRAQGLLGLRVHWEEHVVGRGLYVCGFIEPCMAAELGFLQVGDEILTVDGREVKSEADIVFSTSDNFNIDQVTLKVKRKPSEANDTHIEKYGKRYKAQMEIISSLRKAGYRRDSIEIAEATVALAVMAMENGDLTLAEQTLEEGMNNAYGTDGGVNLLVCTCHCIKGQLAYARQDFDRAHRHLMEGMGEYSKLGEKGEIGKLQCLMKLITVTAARENKEEGEMFKRMADELQQKIIVTQFDASTDKGAQSLLQLGKVCGEAGSLDDSRDFYEKVAKAATSSETRIIRATALRGLAETNLMTRRLVNAREQALELVTLEETLNRDGGDPLVDAKVTLAKVMIAEEGGDMEKACTLLMDCLRFRQEQCGKVHPLVGETCHFLAVAHKRLHAYHLAVHYHHMAIFIFETLYGEKDPVTMACVGSLGITIYERAAFQLETSGDGVEMVHIELKRSFRTPFNPMMPYVFPYIRNLFYDNHKVISNRKDGSSARGTARGGTEDSSSGGPADFLTERGNHLLDVECDFNSAKVLFQQCYNFLSANKGPTHNSTLRALYRLADASRELGCYAEARLLYTQAHNLYIENAGDKLALSFALCGWAECFLCLGDLVEAKAKYSEALLIQKNQIQLGVEGVDTYLAELGLCKVLVADCKWTEALRQLDRLNNKVKGDLGSLHIMTAHVALLLARAKRGRGHHNEVKSCLDQAFVVLRNIISEDHLYFANALYEQAEYFSVMGEQKEAQARYDAAYEVFVNFLGEDHPTVYNCRCSIAKLQMEAGHIREALGEFEELLKCREDMLGANHPVVADNHLLVGECMRVMGKFEEAQQHNEMAHVIIKPLFGHDHPKFADVRFAEAECARSHGQLEKARALHAEAMKIRRDAYGKDHPDFVKSMQGKADLDSNCDSNMEEVATLCKRILKANKNFYSEDHLTIANALNTLGLVLRQQNKLHDALEKFNESLKLRLELGDPKHYAIAELKNNIALLKASLVEGAGDGGDEEIPLDRGKEAVKVADSDDIEGPAANATSSTDTAPKPPTDSYDGAVDQTPVFVNHRYRKAIEDMNIAIEMLRETFPDQNDFHHPTIANIEGNIGIIEKLEDEGKRDFILRLSTKQRALFREAEEKRLSEEFANMSADFSDAPAGTVRLTIAIDYFKSRGYGHQHPWLRKFQEHISASSTEIPEDAEPKNAAQLKANRKLMEAREKMKQRLYDAAKRYYEETLERLPDAEFRPEDTLSYAMAGECLNGLADIARIHCRLADSRDFYLRSLNILRKVSGDNETAQYGDALLGYSELLCLEGEYFDSSENIDKVVAIKKRLLGEKHDSVVDCLYRKVIVLFQTGKFNEGFELCQYVLDARLGLLKAHSDLDVIVKIGETYNTMASFWSAFGKYDKAESCIQLALKTVRSKLNDQDHMVVADCYSLKGDLRMAQCKNKEALRNFGHAIAMKMRLFLSTKKTGDSEGDLGQDSVVDPAEFVHVTVAVSLFGQAEALRRDGKYQLAAELYLKSAKMYNEIFQGHDNPAIADVMFGQAENYRLFGKFSNADQLHGSALAMRQRVFGECHPSVAESLVGLGCLRQNQCRFEESLVNFQLALQIRTDIFGADHPKSADSFLHIANVERELGRYDSAEVNYLKALQCIKPLFGEAHVAVCPTLFGLAENYRAQERYDDAGVLYTLVVSVTALAYGEGHPDVGLYAIGHATNLAILGNYPESKVSAQRALQIFNKCFGADHPCTIGALMCIARALHMAGRYSKTLPYFQRSLDFMKRTFDPKDGPHVVVSDCYFAVGMCLNSLGRNSEAKDHYLAALEIRRTILGSDHVETVAALSGLAETERLLGNLLTAEKFQDEALTQSQELRGNKANLLGSLAMSRLADTIRFKGKLHQAKLMHERALQVRQKLLGGRHPLVALSYQALAEVLMEMGKYDVAKGMFEKSLTLNRQLHREYHPVIGESYYGVAECMREMGFYAQAQETYFKAVHIVSKELGMEHPTVVKMMIGFAENRKMEGFIYTINSSDDVVPYPSMEGDTLTEDNFDFVPENIDNLLAYPILTKAYATLLKLYGPRHYDVLHAKLNLASMLLSLGKFNDALGLYRELISAYKLHYEKDYMYMAPVLFGLAEVERYMGKVAPKRKLFKDVGKPNLSVEGITGSRTPSRASTRNQSGTLPKISSVMGTSLSSIKKTKMGYMGYEYPDVKSRDLDPSAPIDHVILNEIEVALREKDYGSRRNRHEEEMASMINEPSRIYDIALRLHTELYGSDKYPHPFTGDILFGKAELLRNRRDFDESHVLYKKAYANRLRALRNGHPLLATTLFGLAENYRLRGNLKDAKSYHDQALQLRFDAFGNSGDGMPLHVSIAESKLGICSVLFDRGLYHDAIVPCEESIVIRRQVCGSDHFLTAQSEHMLANIYLALQDHEKASGLFEHALQVKKATYGTSHVEVATCMSNFALMLKAQGDYDKALKMFHKVMNIQMKLYGAVHPDVASSLNNIGAVYFAKGMFAESLPYYQKSLEMKRTCFGSDHANVAASLHNLGGVYQSLQNYSRAKELYEEALSIQTSLFDYFHPCIADTMNNLGILLFSQGEYEEAESVYDRALEIKQRVYGANHPAYASSLHNLAALLHSLGRLQDAKNAYIRCREIRTEHLGSDHPDTVACVENLRALKLQQLIEVEKCVSDKIEMYQ